jgi:hypothetical protein
VRSLILLPCYVAAKGMPRRPGLSSRSARHARSQSNRCNVELQTLCGGYCGRKSFLLSRLLVHEVHDSLTVHEHNEHREQYIPFEQGGVLRAGQSSNCSHRRMFKHQRDDDAEFGSGLETSQDDILEAKEPRNGAALISA